MNEHVFFQEGTVLVTNTRFVVGGQTFAMANVTSARVQFRSLAGAATLLLLVGVSTIGLGALMTMRAGGGSMLICSATGFVMIAIGLLLWKFGSSADLFLGTAGGERPALRGKPEFIQRVAAAVSDAIVSRG